MMLTASPSMILSNTGPVFTSRGGIGSFFSFGRAAIRLERVERDVADDEMRHPHVAQNAMLRRAALHVLEQQHRRIKLLVAQLEERADLQMRVSAA